MINGFEITQCPRMPSFRPCGIKLGGHLVTVQDFLNYIWSPGRYKLLLPLSLLEVAPRQEVLIFLSLRRLIEIAI